MTVATLEQRFWPKVDRSGGPDACWQWLAYRNEHGYGKFYVDEQVGPKRAHRISYELLVGPIPEGLTLDHLCKNPACVNPAHLEPVPQGINALRGESPPARNARRDRCPQGHAYDAVRARGWRRCSTCDKEHERRRTERRSAERRARREERAAA